MANRKTSEEAPAEAPKQYDNSKWSIPSKRAKLYATERKQKIHAAGRKKGQPLTDYEAGMRSAYLQCQHDHAGLWKYRKALELGYSKSEAKKMSKQPWDKDTPPKKKKSA